MKKPRFKVIRNCSNCIYAQYIGNNRCLCYKRHEYVMEYDNVCRKYKYKGKGEPKRI